MFCGKCGTKLQDGAKFCQNCGAKVGESVAKAKKENKSENLKKVSFKPEKINIPKVKFTEIIPPMFEWARDFGEGLAAIQDIGDSGSTSVVGFIDLRGNLTIDIKIRNAGSFSEGLCAVSIDGDKWGFIDKTGELVIPCIYDKPEDLSKAKFKNGYCLCKKNDDFVLIDKYGKETIFDDCDEAEYLSDEGFVSITNFSGKGLFDVHGIEIIPCNYSSIDEFYFYKDIIRIDTSYFDRNGNKIEFEYEPDYGNFVLQSNLIKVQNDDLYGFCNEKGKCIIPCIYKDASDFSEGFAFVKNDFGWMTIDENENIIAKTDVNYDSIINNNGIGTVSLSFRDGIVDKYFNELTKFEYKPAKSLVFNVHHDYARITDNKTEKQGLIDRNGKEILKCNYDSVIVKKEDIDQGIVKVKHNNKEVYFDLNTGEELFTPGQYDVIYSFCYGYAMIKKGNKFGYISCIPNAKTLTKEDIGASKLDKEYINNVKKREKQELENSKKIEEGQIIEMGGFQWIVLNVVKSKGKALLLSKDCVSYGAYDDTRYNNTEGMSTIGKFVFKLTGGQEKTYIDDVVWANSGIRSFLNTSFYNKFFSDEEKARILKTNISTTGKRSNHTYGGEDTSDRLFLLSIEEFKKYMYPGESSIALYMGTNYGWWLRSPGIDNETVASIDTNGEIDMYKYQFADCGTRPAMYIKI